MEKPNNLPAAPSFGGDWTKTKLGILERYLDSYTTALKRQPFDLIYVDGFAGSGGIKLGNQHAHPDLADYRELVAGSAKLAIETANKRFDELVFIEADNERVQALDKLSREHNDRNIDIRRGDANEELQKLRRDWRSTRGVLFLDPFGLSVKWSTIDRIASFEALDTWILFPVGTVSRILPRNRVPQDISIRWADRLTAVYGDERWEALYAEAPQRELFGEPGQERAAGVDELLRIYKGRLSELFGERYLEKSVRLRNSRGAPLYEFIFCAGNPRGARVAKKIAKHILSLK